MLQRYCLLLLISLTTLAACTPFYSLQKEESKTYALDSLVTGADEVTAIIAPYKKELSAQMDQVIGEAAVNMEKAQPESLLGNFVADAILDISRQKSDTPIDFAVSNYGGLRIPNLPAGPITIGNIFELMPFENMLTIVYLDGATTRTFLDHVAAKGGWPVSKELSMMLNPNVGKAEMITINGEPLDEKKEYAIVVSDYMANGGDDCAFLVGKKRNDIGLLFRDALLDYVKQETAAGKKINTSIQRRSYYAE